MIVVGNDSPLWGQQLGTDLDGLLTQQHRRLHTAEGSITTNTAAITTNTAAITTNTAALAAGSGPGFIPIGGSLLWWTDTLPSGYGTYAWANGQAVSRTAFATAFAMFGTTYGAGNGSTTFNLPDLRDNVPVGKGTMGGATAVNRIITGVTGFVSSTLGAMFGAALHTLALAQTPSNTISGTTGTQSNDHTHGVSATTGGVSVGHTHGVSGSTGTESVTHSHSGTTGTASANHQHHFAGDTGGTSNDHTHSYVEASSSGTQKPTNSGTAPLDVSTAVNSGGQSADHTHHFDDFTDFDGANHTHSITTGTENIAHTHSFNVTSASQSVDHTHSFSTTSAGINASHSHTFSASNGGGGGSHNSVPPSIVCNFIIRVL